MVQPHGDHAHILQSPVFPLLSAPFIAVFGLRGAYALPALAFIAMLPLAYALTQHTRWPPPLLAVATGAALLNPLQFYALEFWEHVPAACLLGLATWLLARETPRPALSGAAVAVATLLRPESAWYGLALCTAFARPRQAPAFIAWVAIPLGLFAVGSLVETGTMLGPHAASAMSTLGSNWGATHGARLVIWFGLASPAVVAGLAVCAAAVAAKPAGLALETRQVIVMSGALVVAAAGAAGFAGADAIWRAWPVGLAVLVPTREPTRLRRGLLLVLGMTALGVWATSTHDGGAQWGPRFLLVAAPAMVALTAIALADVSLPGALRGLRLALTVALVAVGAWNCRSAYLELRGVKEVYATLVRRVAEVTPQGGYVVTDAWWLGQVAASLQESRTFLTSETVAGIRPILDTLAAAQVETVTLVWSDDPGEPGPLDRLLPDTCWRETSRTSIRERALTALTVRCAGLGAKAQ